MGIKKLTSSILKEGEEEAAKIVQSAKWHIQKMLEEEKAKKQGQKAAVENEVKQLLEDKRRERLAWARLEAKRLIAEGREDAIKKALDEIYALAPSVRETPAYQKWLSSQVEAALEELGEKAVVRVVKGDRKHLPKVKAKVEEDLDALGGAVVEIDGGRMRIDLRLETLFERRADDIRRALAAKLFG
jgi:vacuolar-type H+-ATPase subunit E/Vma4